MKILCITDQFEGSDHSAIKGIFEKYLLEFCEVYVVYFSKNIQEIRKCGTNIYVPYAFKRQDIIKELNKVINLEDIDIVIVRNFFPVLKTILRYRQQYGYRIGFWHSFPHTFRRIYEAKLLRKSIFRKTIEYKIKTLMEYRLLRQCDFMISMSDQFKKYFHNNLAVKYFSLPMGVDFATIPVYRREPKRGIKKFIYTGTIDPLREVDIIAQAFHEIDIEYRLDFFTKSDNQSVRWIKDLNDRRINVYPYMSRDKLMKLMEEYHVGIGLLPEAPIYSVSSPTKTLEYYSMGLPAIINYLPEYVSLFDEESAFFCKFEKEDIKKTINRILSIPEEEIMEVGSRGYAAVKAKRDYRTLSRRLFNFLQSIAG